MRMFVAAVPPLLELLCCDIARYRLMTRPTDEARQRFEDALSWLDKVAQGKIDLGGATNDAPPVAGGAVGVAPGGRVFDRHSLRDFTDPSGRA